MSMYKNFKTDPDLERKGIVIDYGDFRVTTARAGGANKKFAKLLAARTKPHARAIQTDTMDPELALELLRRVYAEAIVLNWETKVNGEFKVGIEPEDGSEKLLPFNSDNVELTLTNLPDIFTDLQDQASKMSLYLSSLKEANAGN